MVSNFETRRLVGITVTEAGAGCFGVAVIIIPTVDHRLNPAPIYMIFTTEPPAAVWPAVEATVSALETGNKSALVVNENGIISLTLPRERSLGTNEHQRRQKNDGR